LNIDLKIMKRFDPQIMGAMGAALFAKERVKDRTKANAG